MLYIDLNDIKTKKNPQEIPNVETRMVTQQTIILVINTNIYLPTTMGYMEIINPEPHYIYDTLIIET